MDHLCPKQLGKHIRDSSYCTTSNKTTEKKAQKKNLVSTNLHIMDDILAPLQNAFEGQIVSSEILRVHLHLHLPPSPSSRPPPSQSPFKRLTWYLSLSS